MLPPVLNLNIPPLLQSKQENCWACRASMICQFLKFDPCPTENEISTLIDGPWDQYDLPASYLQIQAVYRKLGIEFVESPLPLALPVLLGELADISPVAIDIEWESGGGHCILATGYDQNGLILVNNPSRGREIVPHRWLLSGYGVGRWVRSDGRFKRKGAGT